MPRRAPGRELPKENLARNLAYLLKKHELSYRDLSEKTGGEVSPKTISNMINAVGSSNIDKVDAIAAVFGLSGWHLIAPNLIGELNDDGSGIRILYESFLQSSAEGRRHIIRVAEREAEYSTDPRQPEAS